MMTTEEAAYFADDAELQSWRNALNAKREALYANPDRIKFNHEVSSEQRPYRPGHGNVLKGGMSMPVQFERIDYDALMRFSPSVHMQRFGRVERQKPSTTEPMDNIAVFRSGRKNHA